MASPVGCSVTKQFTWRGVAEEFSNVYHFASEAAGVGEEEYAALANAVANKERALFGPQTSFLRYRVWGPTDAASKADIKMLAVGDLSGVGSKTSVSVKLPKEMAVCVGVYIGRGPKGGKQFLRKYWHIAEAGTELTDEMAKGNVSMLSGTQDAFASSFEDFFSITASLVGWDLSNSKGKKVPAGEQAFCLPHLHTRNLHR